jgi:metal transporter CNNM
VEETIEHENQINEIKSNLQIVGFRIEHSEKEPEIEDGVPVLRADTKVTLRLFGHGFQHNTSIGLTTERNEFGTICNMLITTGKFNITMESSTNAKVEVLLPKNSVEMFICATNNVVRFSSINVKTNQKQIFHSQPTYYHQGVDTWMSLKSMQPMLPIWVQVCIICTCLCFSALFSGLNLGLMSLDRTDLKVSDVNVVFDILKL